MPDESTKLTVDIGATNGAKSVLSDAIKDFSNFWKSITGGNSAGQAASNFEGLAGKIGITGNAAKLAMVGGIGLLAAGLVVAGVHAVQVAGNFQQATSTLVTTAGVTEKNLGTMRNGILQVSDASGYAADAVSQAMYVIASHTFNATSGASNGLLVLKASAQAARTENADLGTVALAVSSAMVDYHLSASQAADTASKLTAAVGAGGATFQEFSGALHSVLPIAAAAHVSLNDILGDVASMTQHGMSADQATQNLAMTIRSLQKPSQQASQYLAGIGISASDLSNDLGTKGVSGTLEMISTAIMEHMGPSGKVLISSFNQSKSAAADLQTMIAAMPASVQGMAKAYENGTMSYKDFQKAAKDTGGVTSALLQQFEASAKSAQGFNNLLKSGSPTALSYSQALQQATGNATTLNTALMISGENYKNTTTAINAVSKAHADAKGNVMGWAEIQGNFNLTMDRFRQTINNTFIALGMQLLPAATQLATFLMGTMTNAINGVGNFFGQLGNKGSAAGKIFAELGKLFMPSLTALWNALSQMLFPSLGMIFSALGKIIGSLGPVLIPLLKIAAVIIGVTLYAALWLTINAIRILAEGIAYLNAMISFVEGWVADAIHWFLNLYHVADDMKGIGGQIVRGLIAGLTGNLSELMNAIGNIGGSMIKGLKGILGIHSPSAVFAEIGQNMGAGLIQGLQQVAGQTKVAVTGLVTGSGLVNSSGAPTTSNNSVTTNNNTTANNQNGSVNIYIQAPNGATLQSIMASINQGALNTGRGLTPGAY